jgi:hypothetical protein
VNTSALCNGVHAAVNLAANGSTTNPSYAVQWTIENIVGSGVEALVIPTPVPTGTEQLNAKKVTVTVTHLRNPNVNAKLVRYIRIEPAT